MPKRHERFPGELEDSDEEIGLELDIAELAHRAAEEPGEITEDDVRTTFSEVGALSAQEARDSYTHPFLIGRIAGRTSRNLERLGLDKAYLLDGESYEEICLVLGLPPDEEQSPIALEDLLFGLQQEDYEGHNAGDPITIHDLEEAGSKFEDAVELKDFQESMNQAAYEHTRQLVEDPILELHVLNAKRQGIINQRGQKEMSMKLASTFDEYVEQEKEVNALAEEIDGAAQQVAKLMEIGEVKERRERAIRRFSWLMRQDYMSDIELELREKVAQNNPLNFEEAARLATTKVKQFLKEHVENGVDLDSLTDKQRRIHEIKARRLKQARAVCEVVFEEDNHDHIYEDNPIDSRQWELLLILRKRLYRDREVKFLNEMVAFMPGSPARLAETSFNKEKLVKLGGRSVVDLFGDISAIIDNDPDMDEPTIEVLVQKKMSDELTDDEELELAEDMLLVIEKLAYRHKYLIPQLLKKD